MGNLFAGLVAWFFIIFLSTAYASSVDGEVTLGIVDTNEPGWRAQTLNPTLDHLHRTLPQYKFRIVELSVYQTIEDVGRTRPDFIVAPSDVFLQLINIYGAQALAVRQTNFAANPTKSVGSTIVVAGNRKDLQNLADLEDKVIAASLPDSLGGWLALKGEIHSAGYDENTFFKRTNFLSFQIPDVINHVIAGYSDAGVLSACQLEIALQSGLIEEDQLRVIGAKPFDGLACKHSTALYPDQVFGALNFDRQEVLKRVSIALLSMPQRQNFSWQVAGKFDSVSSLYQDLAIGPWAHQKWTIQRFLEHFYLEILIVSCMLLLLLINEFRLNRLVQKRTKALKQTLREKDEIAQREAQTRERIGLMERNTIAAQMSSMIAHELKQPLASIINYMAVMKMQLETLEVDDARVDRAADGIENEAIRITQIVDRVRSYVKRPHTNQSKCSLSEIVRKALLSFQHYTDRTPNVRIVSLEKNLNILGDELELEILVLNILKNASDAVRKTEAGLIELQTMYSNGKCLLIITDNGPKLTDEAFEHLTAVSESTSGGLGLGLGIVRSIADAHSADLQIERLPERGIRVRVAFDSME